MATPHNSAEKGQFAGTVLMPGDPLRAKMIAENFLENAELINQVRGMYAYTGTYKGKKVSVMAHGMGMPSVGIYTWELFSFYDVERIIRIGSAGSYVAELEVGDTVLATETWTESSYAKAQTGEAADTNKPSKDLNEALKKTAEELQIPLKEARVHCSDIFYRADKTSDAESPALLHGCSCVEMESFALFQNAKVLGKQAACLLTITDSFVTSVEMTAEERQNNLRNMIEIALETAIQDENKANER